MRSHAPRACAKRELQRKGAIRAGPWGAGPPRSRRGALGLPRWPRGHARRRPLRWRGSSATEGQSTKGSPALIPRARPTEIQPLAYICAYLHAYAVPWPWAGRRRDRYLWEAPPLLLGSGRGTGLGQARVLVPDLVLDCISKIIVCHLRVGPEVTAAGRQQSARQVSVLPRQFV